MVFFMIICHLDNCIANIRSQIFNRTLCPRFIIRNLYQRFHFSRTKYFVQTHDRVRENGFEFKHPGNTDKMPKLNIFLNNRTTFFNNFLPYRLNLTFRLKNKFQCVRNEWTAAKSDTNIKRNYIFEIFEGAFFVKLCNRNAK